MAASRIDRFKDPLYTRAEAARFLGIPEGTFGRWAKNTGYVSSLAAGPRSASIPFIGLAEAYTLHALRVLKVPLQRIRPALDRLRDEVGLEHALASQKLYTDGAEVLYEYSKDTGDESIGDLVVVRHQQPVFRDVIADYLKQVSFSEGYAQRIPLTGFQGADIFVDPSRGFGQPVFARGGARLTDALDLFRAGEKLGTVAHEYGIPRPQLEAALRASLDPAA